MEEPITVLVVDDEHNIRTSLRRILTIEGYSVITASDGAEAMALVSPDTVDVALLDVYLPDTNGLDLLLKIKDKAPSVVAIMMSGHAGLDSAVTAIKAGAYDFLEKPIGTDKLLVTMANALELSRVSSENALLRAQVDKAHHLVTASPRMGAVLERISLAAPTASSVLITGESGTGKELVAREIHRRSTRAGGPFVKLNCAAIPKELMESELFGHEKGAFTGAHSARKGKFEMAHKGTLLLDEIGDLHLDAQAKLLRVLQEGELTRVGGSKELHVDVRIVAATNKNLPDAIKEGAFREDLYYRINVVPIHIPPLRERSEEIRALVGHFVSSLCQDNGWKEKELGEDALQRLESYAFPGNVRELRNLIERLLILSPGPRITAKDVRALMMGGEEAPRRAVYRPGVGIRTLVEEFEREVILAALAEHEHNVSKTSQDLKIERSHLYRKMKGLGI